MLGNFQTSVFKRNMADALQHFETTDRGLFQAIAELHDETILRPVMDYLANDNHQVRAAAAIRDATPEDREP